MLQDVVEVKPLGRKRIFVRFEDGVAGEVDLAEVIEFTGIFAPWLDDKEFARVRVDAELGTIVW